LEDQEGDGMIYHLGCKGWRWV